MTTLEKETLQRAIADGTSGLTDEEIAGLDCWELFARPEQLPPDGDWSVFYCTGGRGSGKTRAGAETLADLILTSDPLPDGMVSEWGIVAPTFGAARKACVEGPSGLRRALGGMVEKGGHVVNWNRSIGELYVDNGAIVYVDSADDGALRVQGNNLRGCWLDEVGLWDQWETAWNESIAFAVRIEPARIVATGTPKSGHPLVRLLLNDPTVAVSRMRMIDNARNLHRSRVAALTKKYAGTRLGRQELDGEFLEEVIGALWRTELIDQHRVTIAPHLDRIVVGVDPSGAADEDTGANEIGIVAAGFSVYDQHGYVIADRSLRAGPHEWASAVVGCYHDLQADVIVAERNFGGEMVRHTIQSVDRNVPVKLVTSSRGKALRAEPVSTMYEQGRVHHVGLLAKLEDQMTSWVPPKPGERAKDSPDRLDALVFAITELMVDQPGGRQYESHEGMTEPVRRRGDLVQRGARYIDK